MKKKQTKKQQKHPLTLHGLIGALSFWGTASRAFLFSILAAAVLIVALSEASTANEFDTQIMLVMYVVGAFLLLDFGYVMIARAYPLQKILDIGALLAADILLALLYIVPKVVVSQSVVLKTDPLVFALFVPIIVLSLRSLVGILIAPSRR